MAIKLRHLAIACPDPEKTAKLYARLFNLKVVPAKNVGQAVALTDGYFNLTFISPPVAAKTVNKVPQSKGFAVHHIGFTVPSVSEFRALAESEGCTVVKEYESGQIMKLQDPDGLHFDVAAEDRWAFA